MRLKGCWFADYGVTVVKVEDMFFFFGFFWMSALFTRTSNLQGRQNQARNALRRVVPAQLLFFQVDVSPHTSTTLLYLSCISINFSSTYHILFSFSIRNQEVILAMLICQPIGPLVPSKPPSSDL